MQHSASRLVTLIILALMALGVGITSTTGLGIFPRPVTSSAAPSPAQPSAECLITPQSSTWLFPSVIHIQANISQSKTGNADQIGAEQAAAINSGFYVFSTLAQVLGGMLAIYLAIFFILAQLATKQRYSRVVGDLYRGGSVSTLLAFYIFAIIYALVMLARMPTIVHNLQLVYLNVGIIIGVGALFMIVPAVMAQVENLIMALRI